MHHGSRRGHEVRFADMVPLFLLRHHAANEFFQFFVTCAALHLRVQIVVPDRKKAGTNFAIAGNADAAAMSAEGMRDGSYNPDLADSVFEAIAPCRLRARVGNLDQWPVFG